MAGPAGKPGAKAPGARIPGVDLRTGKTGTVQRRPSHKGVTNFKPTPLGPGTWDHGTSSSPEGRAPAPKATAKPKPTKRAEPMPRARAQAEPHGPSKPRAHAAAGSNASTASAARALYRANKGTIGADRNLLKVGATLDVKGKKYKVKRGDTLWGIASRSGG